jgi:hypothetical protein
LNVYGTTKRVAEYIREMENLFTMSHFRYSSSRRNIAITLSSTNVVISNGLRQCRYSDDNELRIDIGIQLPEKYKQNFDIGLRSKRRSSICLYFTGTCIPQSAVCIFANVICISTNVSPPYSSVSSHGELLFLRDFNDG